MALGLVRRGVSLTGLTQPMVADLSVGLTPSSLRSLSVRMPNLPPAIDLDKLRLAEPADLKESLAFALRFEGKKRRHDADDYMARIVADRLVRHLERSGYVVMKRPPAGGHANLACGHRGEE
jgi:hypothetical protein